MRISCRKVFRVDGDPPTYMLRMSGGHWLGIDFPLYNVRKLFTSASSGCRESRSKNCTF